MLNYQSRTLHFRRQVRILFFGLRELSLQLPNVLIHTVRFRARREEPSDIALALEINRF